MIKYTPYKNTLVEQSLIEKVKAHIEKNIDDNDYNFTILVVTSDCYHETQVIVTDDEGDIRQEYVIYSGSYFRLVNAKDALTFKLELILNIKLDEKQELKLEKIFDEEISI